ncbi:MAG: hypothetical protein E7086_09985 [Bacteroidales bacterium]|nr:hypothetical protein [Bacteroidales bacterium]
MLRRIKMARSTYYYNVAHLETADKYQAERKRIARYLHITINAMAIAAYVPNCAMRAMQSTTRLCRN